MLQSRGLYRRSVVYGQGCVRISAGRLHSLIVQRCSPKPSEIRSLNLDENQCVALIEVDIEQLIKKEFKQND